MDKQSLGYQDSLDFPILGPDGNTYVVEHKNPTNKVARWRWSEQTVKEKYNELVFIYPYVYTKNYEKEGSIPRNLLIEERFGRTRTGKTDFAALFNKIAYFSFPKPIKLLRYLISIISNKDSIIIDFFSGSATTAHAVMQLNAEDGGKRRFIMVQLPEKCAENSEAAKAGYENICEIGKERIRRAGEKIKSENAGKPGIERLDTGFRVLKCNNSNMKDVYFNADETDQESLDELVDNVREDRTSLDLLFGCLTEWGLPLSLPYKSGEICGATVHFYDPDPASPEGAALAACFDKNISEEAIRAIAARKPVRAVFRDACFACAEDRINAGEFFKTLAPDTEVKVI